MCDKIEITVKERSKVIIKNQKGYETGYHILKIPEENGFTGEFKQIKIESKLAQLLLGKKERDKFLFGETEYEILRIL